MKIDVERKPDSDKVKLTVVADNANDTAPGRLADALRAGGQGDLADKWVGQLAKLAAPPKKGKKGKARPKKAKLELTDAQEIRSFADCIRNVWPAPTREISDALAGVA